MAIKITAGSVEELRFARGYGLHKKAFIGLEPSVHSYASIQLEPTLNGTRYCSVNPCAGESFTFLLNREMPPKWQDLSEDKKERFKINVRDNIKEAMKDALEKAKL